MRRSSKTEFNRAIEDASDVRAEGTAAASAPLKSKHPSRIILTALVIVVGAGAGWLGGKVLSGRMRNSPAAAPASDPPTSDGSTPLSSASPESHPSKRTSGATVPLSQPAPEAEPPAVASEPRSVEPEPKVAPPKTPKLDKEDESEMPTAEDAAREIGRQAFKKMSKDLKRMKRGLANKNENEKQP